MEYITRQFENTRAGLAQKDAATRQLASQGYRIISEQIEAGHAKGDEQCCGALICLPLIFAAGRTPGIITVTYGRELTPPVQALFCTSCGARVLPETAFCRSCGIETRGNTTPDEGAALVLAEKKQIAKERTAEAQRSISDLGDVLLETIKIDHRVDWGATAKQYAILKPTAPAVRPLSKRPDVADFEYRPSFLIKLVPSIRNKRSDSAQERFLRAKAAWNKERERFDTETARDNHEYQQALNKWEADRKVFDEGEAAISESRRKLYFGKDATALKEYWETVISRSTIPAGLKTNYSFTYFEDRRSLVVECGLPSLDSIPKVQEVRYAANKKAFEESLFQRTWQDDFYERLIHNITLKALYELFQSDSANALDTVVFNGFVRAIDRAIGHEVKAYIISVQAAKPEFLAINLSQVDPKACVRRLKGGVSERMSELVPIEPPASR